jgi:hypothetical protein
MLDIIDKGSTGLMQTQPCIIVNAAIFQILNFDCVSNWTIFDVGDKFK